MKYITDKDNPAIIYEVTNEKNPEGRKTVFTPEVLHKLEEAFAIGASDIEAIFYANVSRAAFYHYQAEHPEFLTRKEELKERPVLKARQVIVKNLDQPEHAKWYLERKKKDEFAQRSEFTGKGGERLIPDAVIKEKADQAIDTYLNGGEQHEPKIDGLNEGRIITGEESHILV